MSRPLRLEFAQALYHVTSRGDRREPIYVDDLDRTEWLAVLSQVCARFNWRCHAWCLMGNHFHGNAQGSSLVGTHRGQVLSIAFCPPPLSDEIMSRPLRIEFSGAVYHVTSRGDRREPIYLDDEDRLRQLAILAQAMQRFDAQVLAYCLMGNHFHLERHRGQVLPIAFGLPPLYDESCLVPCSSNSPAPFITSPPAVTAVSRFTSTRWPNSRTARSAKSRARSGWRRRERHPGR